MTASSFTSDWLMPSGQSAEDSYHFEPDPNGRPIIPDILILTQPLDADRSTKLTALEWARRWNAIDGYIEEDGALNCLDTCLSKGWMHPKSSEEKIVVTAIHALYRWHHAGRAKRTSRGLPWVQFLAIDGEPRCERATELNGRIFAIGDNPVIPVPWCNSARCTCIYIQRTDGWLRRNRPENH